jgi:hypothetical protein
MAVAKTKTAKKVNTAKGKGKVVKKAVAKKPAVKKAVKVIDPNAYGKFYIEDCPTEKFPELVTITKAPKAYADLLGKRFINRSKCICTIDAEKAEGAISKGAKAVKEELIAAGLVGIEAE